jgi:hypothetical protein
VCVCVRACVRACVCACAIEESGSAAPDSLSWSATSLMASVGDGFRC